MTRKFVNGSKTFSRGATGASPTGKATPPARLQRSPPAPPQRTRGIQPSAAAGVATRARRKEPPEPPPPPSRSPGAAGRPPGLPPPPPAPPGGCRCGAGRPGVSFPPGAGPGGGPTVRGTRRATPAPPFPHAPLGPASAAHLTEPHAWRRGPPPPSHWPPGEDGGVWLVFGVPIPWYGQWEAALRLKPAHLEQPCGGLGRLLEARA